MGNNMGSLAGCTDIDFDVGLGWVDKDKTGGGVEGRALMRARAECR